MVVSVSAVVVPMIWENCAAQGLSCTGEDFQRGPIGEINIPDDELIITCDGSGMYLSCQRCLFL